MEDLIWLFDLTVICIPNAHPLLIQPFHSWRLKVNLLQIKYKSPFIDISYWLSPSWLQLVGLWTCLEEYTKSCTASVGYVDCMANLIKSTMNSIHGILHNVYISDWCSIWPVHTPSVRTGFIFNRNWNSVSNFVSLYTTLRHYSDQFCCHILEGIANHIRLVAVGEAQANQVVPLSKSLSFCNCSFCCF